MKNKIFLISMFCFIFLNISNVKAQTKDTIVKVLTIVEDDVEIEDEIKIDDTITEGKAKEQEKCIHRFYYFEPMPLYPGGLKALQKFLRKNIKYPEEARKKNIEGKVYVRFLITKKGKVDSVSIARGIHPLLDREAVRVVKLLPDWTPAEKRGKTIGMLYTLPINFTLGDKK